MKFETLKNRYNKKILLIIVVLLLVGTIIISTSLAKYKITESIQLVKGTINYSPSDLNVMAIYLESDNGYVTSDSIPESGYALNSEESYCKVDDNEINTTISYDISTQTLSIAPITSKGTKCFLYFDILETFTIDEVIANKNIATRTDLSTVLTTDTTGTIYNAEDDDGTSYYYAGAPTDNYVKFGKWSDDTPDIYYGYYSEDNLLAKEYSTLLECENASSYNYNCTVSSRAGKNMYWRIIRINGDGTIRLIYAGTSAIANGTSAIDTQIGTSPFASEYEDNMYVGYMYTSGSLHGLGTDSVIKDVLDNWYENYLTSYSNYISYDTGFCGDRTITNGTGTGATNTTYSAYTRVYSSTASPSLKCTESSDLYTTNSSSKGNKKLTYPIGMITADEIAYAGEKMQTTNQSYYLYTGNGYWTMTPFHYSTSTGGAYVFRLGPEGTFEGKIYGSVGAEVGIRPVINLKADTLFSGSGTSTDPYVVS